MKSSEMEKFEQKYGFLPTRISVALDALAIFVSKDNPIKSLSLPEIDAIFSSTRRGNYPSDIKKWGQLGLKGQWQNSPISLYGRNSASGTYGYYKSTALFKGDFKKTVKEQPGSASVVQGIAKDKFGIGYSGIGFITSEVKTVAISKKHKKKAYEASYKNVLAGKYPLSRALYVYVVKEPNKPINPLTNEFLNFILSKKGQEIVIKDGYLPLPAKLIQKQLQLL